jgi:hypothetical protein
MLWPKGKILEEIVNEQVVGLAKAVLRYNPDVICPIPRRAARIFDVFLPADLQKEIESKILYPSARFYSPESFSNSRIALIDNCVQRGKNLRNHIRLLSQEGRNTVDAFAFARCQWQGKNAQYSKVRINEPLLECDEFQYNRITSHINYRFWNSILPLDYEDILIEQDFKSAIDVNKIEKVLTRLGPTNRLPVGGSKIIRYSCFVKDSTFLNGLVPEAGILEKDVETKILVNIDPETGKSCVIPLALYKVDIMLGELSSSEMFTGYMSRLGEPLKIDSNAPERTFISAHLAAESILAGRFWKALRQEGIECNLQIKKSELTRFYGLKVGENIFSIASEVISESMHEFNPVLSAPSGRPNAEMSIANYELYADQIRRILVDEYLSHNIERDVDVIDWDPHGLTFSELHERLRTNGFDSVNDVELSLVLDGLLAASWIKTQTGESSTRSHGSLLATTYTATELTSADRPEESIKSFSGSVDEEREHNTRDLICLVSQSLTHTIGQVDIPIGHWEHCLTFVLRLLHDWKTKTILEPHFKPHGVIPVVVPCRRLHEGSPIEEAGHFLGFRIVNVGQKRFVRTNYEISQDSVFSNNVRALVREFEWILEDWYKNEKELQKLLLFLSSCPNTRVALDAIHYDLKGLEWDSTRLLTGRRVSDREWEDLTKYVRGGLNKLQVSEQSASYHNFLQRELETHRSRLSPTLHQAFAQTGRNHSMNPCLSVFHQLVEEGSLILSMTRKASNQIEIFEEQSDDQDVPTISLDKLSLWWQSFQKLVMKLEMFTQIDFELFEKGQPKQPISDVIKELEQFRTKMNAENHEFKNLILVKIDAVGSTCDGDLARADDMEKHREGRDWIIWQFFAKFYGGFVPKEKDGDAIYFAFFEELDALRFALSAMGTFCFTGAVVRPYRIMSSSSISHFKEISNIKSQAMINISDMEERIKREEKLIPNSFGSFIMTRDVLPSWLEYFFLRSCKSLNVPPISVQKETGKHVEELECFSVVLTKDHWLVN